MHTVFLDANVLFSAAYRPDAPMQRLWALPDVTLMSSEYAVDEARRNLRAAGQRHTLDGLLTRVLIVPEGPSNQIEEQTIQGLPVKDRPVLRAAIAARATHLLTGDKAHFGRYYGKTIAGVLVLQPPLYPLTPGRG